VIPKSYSSRNKVKSLSKTVNIFMDSKPNSKKAITLPRPCEKLILEKNLVLKISLDYPVKLDRSQC
jgi:hypothetical protein